MEAAAQVGPVGFKDRRAGLLVFGILEIFLGLLAWLMVALMVFATAVAAAQGAPVASGSMVPAVLIYGGAGAVCIVLGIGSIRARRWARALWIVVSAGWLAIGVLAAVFVVIWIPNLLRNAPAGVQGPPPGALVGMMVVMVVFMGIFMVAIPLSLLLFYRSAHVRATCEAAQPSPSWTDACPIPALAAALWIGFLAVMLLVMPLAYGNLFPAFGVFLGGFGAWILWWVLAAVMGASAVGLYGRQVWAWWTALGTLLVLTASTVATYARADLGELYEAMGMEGPQLDQLAAMGFMSPSLMVGMAVAGFLPFGALLFWAWGSLGGKPGGG